MKIIEESKYETCGVCSHTKMIKDEVLGCDYCGKVMDDKTPRLSSSVHKTTDNYADNYHYCSWRCCLSHLKNIETDYFISLPFLHYDKANENILAKDFFNLLDIPTSTEGTKDAE